MNFRALISLANFAFRRRNYSRNGHIRSAGFGSLRASIGRIGIGRSQHSGSLRTGVPTRNSARLLDDAQIGPGRFPAFGK